MPSIDVETRGRLISQAEGIFEQIWEIAAQEARRAPSPVTMSFAASHNDMIDALATRNAAIDRHVPELVLFLLFGTFTLLGAPIRFASAISNVCPGVPVYAMMTRTVILVFLIIDLNRPRRGLIEVDQAKLITTVQQIRE